MTTGVALGRFGRPRVEARVRRERRDGRHLCRTGPQARARAPRTWQPPSGRARQAGRPGAAVRDRLPAHGHTAAVHGRRRPADGAGTGHGQGSPARPAGRRCTGPRRTDAGCAGADAADRAGFRAPGGQGRGGAGQALGVRTGRHDHAPRWGKGTHRVGGPRYAGCARHGCGGGDGIAPAGRVRPPRPDPDPDGRGGPRCRTNHVFHAHSKKPAGAACTTIPRDGMGGPPVRHLE